MVVIESGLIMYAVIYVIGVFQSKQIKTCAIVCRPYKSGVDFAPGRHFGESQPKKLKFLFSRNKPEVKENLNTLELHLKSNPIRNTHRSINHSKRLLSVHVTSLLHDL